MFGHIEAVSDAGRIRRQVVWIWQVRSMDEALEWVKRVPATGIDPNEVSEIEIRPIFETADFGAEMTPELVAQEERLRAEVARQTGAKS